MRLRPLPSLPYEPRFRISHGSNGPLWLRERVEHRATAAHLGLASPRPVIRAASRRRPDVSAPLDAPLQRLPRGVGDGPVRPRIVSRRYRTSLRTRASTPTSTRSMRAWRAVLLALYELRRPGTLHLHGHEERGLVSRLLVLPVLRDTDGASFVPLIVPGAAPFATRRRVACGLSARPTSWGAGQPASMSSTCSVATRTGDRRERADRDEDG